MGTGELRRKCCQWERSKFERKKDIGRQLSTGTNFRIPLPFILIIAPVLIKLICTISVVCAAKRILPTIGHDAHIIGIQCTQVFIYSYKWIISSLLYTSGEKN